MPSPRPTPPQLRSPRQLILLTTVVALVMSLTVTLVAQTVVVAGDPDLCYVVADSGGGNGGNDWLFSVNKITGTRSEIGTGTGTSNIEAAEYDPYTDRMLAADANRLGEIDLTTGVWSALGPAFGTGSGSVGSLSFTDVDSLAMDPFGGILYGVHRRSGGGNLDALFRINPATGVFVPGVFAGGADYILVQPQAGLEDIDDLSVSAQDGIMRGVANNSVGDHLVEIDRFTGATVDVGRFNIGGTGLDDLEGFGSDSQGTLWATHGRTAYDLYTINPATAEATVEYAIPTGGDHESVACLTGTPNVFSGTVFHDTDGNGSLGAETGTPGVTVTLYRDLNGDGAVDGGDVAVTTTTTAGDGTYSFAMSATGKFVASIDTADLPGGHLLTTDNDESADFGIDFDQLDAGNDFGWAMPITIGDLVWEDLDGDAVRDGGEPGIVGVEVVATYHGPDGILGNIDDETFTTNTGAGGAYSFTGRRPGTYTVAVTDPANHILSTGNDPAVVTVASGNSDLSVDYGFYRPADVGDFVWVDVDGDGQQEVGELGLAGVTITLTGAGPDDTFGTGDDTTASSTTDDGTGPLALGEYAFTGLAPGTYRVTFDLTSASGSYVLTEAHIGLDVTDSDATPTGATSGTTASFVLVSGDTDVTIDAGGYELATIGDLVFEDLDGNGVADDGATGIGGVTVNLFESDGVTPVASTVTAADGSYSFSVAPGSYVVDVDESTMPSPVVLTTANEPLSLTVQSGDVVGTADFGYRLETDLSVVKTDSLDPVADVGSFTYTITVTNNGPVDATGVTVVDVLPTEVTYDDAGSTPSCVEAPVGTVTCTIDDVASGASEIVTIAVDVVPNSEGLISNSVSVSADQVESTPVDNSDTETTRVYRPAIISDLVWYDIDGDGLLAGGEPGLAGVDLDLFDATGTVLLASTTTDVDGLYAFDNLAPGSYVVRVDAATLPAGMAPTFDVEGPTDGEAAVTVTSLEINTTTDFGYSAAGSIGDFVFEDVDGDGVLDPGETTGVAGAELELTWAGPDGLFSTGDDVTYATQTTGATGAYDFTLLPAGDYRIDVITHPAGAVLTTANDPLSVTLGAGEDFDLADFGYYLPSTIGDFVWSDTNGDALQDLGEPGLDGVDLTLYLDDGDATFEPSADDVFVASITTAAGGAYDFTGLAPGSYWVDVDESTLPPGAVLTTSNDPHLVVVTSGSDIDDSDFGYDIVATVTEIVYEDVDENGTYDLGIDTPLVGVDVTFTDSESTVQTVTTDAAGTASATVAPGLVSIDIDDATLPAGYGLVAGTDPTDVTAIAGATVTDETGYEPQGTAAEVVFVDSNGNGSLDSGEELDDVDVVFTIDGVPTTVTTDGDGLASVGGIRAGTIVTIDVDDATLPSGLARTVGTDPTDVVVVVATTVTDTTGYEPQGAAAEVVFSDADGDGNLDPGEALAGVDVTVTIGTGTPTTYTTDVNGTITITGILAGTTVNFDVDDTTLPAGSVLTVGTDPTDVVVVANTTVTDTTGYEPRGAAAEVVFLDADGDGLVDPGEELAGVDVTVTIGTAAPVTLTTDANGNVTVTGILAGTTVNFDIDTTDPDFPAGSVLTVGTDPTDVVVVAGSTVTDTTGYEPQGAAAEVVFLDADGDGLLDPGEELSGVDVIVTVGTAAPVTLMTDANGNVTIAGILAGTTVTFDIDDTTLPAGSVLTVGTDPTDVVVVVNSTVTDTTGYEPQGSAAEVVFLDADGDGLLDPGEELANVDVVVTVGTAAPVTLTTDANGNVTVTGILAGTTVNFDIDDTTLPAGSVLTVGTDPTDVIVVANSTVTDTTGYEPQGSAAEVLFLDADGDGLLDPGEELAGVDVIVTIGTAAPVTMTTDANGTVTVTGILAGTTVTFDVDTTDPDFPAGSVLTVGTDPTDVVVVANTTVTDTTGYEPRGSAAEVVFLDADGDGLLDPGEELANVDVVVTVGTAAPVTLTTDANGNVTITGVLAGTTVNFDIDDTTLPAGSVLTVGTDPTDVIVVANSTATDTTGYEPQGSAAEVVFLDADGDGALDPGEELANVDVVVTVGTAAPVTLTTDANGNVTVTGILAGTTVNFDIDDTTLPAGSALTVGTDPTDVTVIAGTTVTDTTGYEPQGAAAEVVFLDADADGLLDPGEELANVDVVVTVGTAAPVTLTTDANGNVTVTGVLAGTTVNFDIDDTTLPAGSVLTVGTDPTDVVVVVNSTVTDTTGYEPRGSAAEVVFLDADGDGALDPGEELANVDVVVTVGTAGPVTLTTDANGTVTVTGVLAGTTVNFDVDGTTLPAGSVLTVGTDPTDVVVVAGTTVTDTTGYEPRGSAAEVVFLDADGDGLLDPGEELSGVDVVVTVGTAAPVTLTTDADGNVTVTGILAGTTVNFDIDDTTLPAGSVLTVGTDPTDVIVVAGTTVTDTTGYEPQGSAAEVLFLDADGDGLLDPGEELANIDVIVTIGTAAPVTMTTDANGTVTVTGVLAGTTVNFDIDTTDPDFPAGSVLTVGTDPTDVVVVAGTTVTDTTGYEPQGSAAEVVFLDADGDGLLDPGEELANVDVVVTIGTAAPVTLTTDANGNVTVTGVLAGTTVNFDIDDTTLPAGSVLTVGTDPTDVVVVAGTTVTDTTGYEPRGAAAEVVFLDADGDGVLDPGEELANVDVVVTVGTGAPATYTTDANGTVSVTGILAGTTVNFDIDDTTVPAGSALTVGTDPTDVSVVAGTTVTDTTGYELASAISITKDPATQNVVGGGTATFTITVENVGTTALTDVTVTDPGYAQCDAFYSSLAVGATQSYSCDVTAVTADFTNVADVSATDPISNVVTDSASADVVVLTPAFTVTKNPATQNVPVNGDAVFTVSITNSGETDLVDLVVDDPLATCDTTAIALLAVGETNVVNCTSTGVTADFTNTVTVTADDPIGTVLTESDTADVVVLTPAIDITKDPANQFVVTGGTATFDITVENTGESDLSSVTVSDPLAPDCDRAIGALAVGETSSYTCTLTPVTADFTNQASVSGVDAVGNIVTANDVADVDMIDPQISIDKTPDLTYARAGDTVDFTITVTNTGDVALTNVVVTDAATPACDVTYATLAIGETQTSTCSTVASADFTNVAAVIADEPAGGTVGDSDDAVVDVIDPAISISKGPATQQVIVNGAATFTIAVTNAGDSALADVVVTDPLTPDCDTTIATLAVGETVTYSCTLDPVAAGFTNTADVTADDLSGQPVTDSDSADVTTVSGAIEIQKTPDLQTILSGDTATFDITVTNSGPIDLFDVTISDPLVPSCDAVIPTLSAGASTTSTCTLAAVATDFTNVASVSAVDAVGNPYADSDDAVVDVIAPSIAVSKTPDLQTVTTGGTATFTIEVTNTGDADLSAVDVTDVAAPDCDRLFPTLLVGETISYSCTLAGVTADFTNVVDVVASEPSGGTVSSSDTADVTVLVPSIEIQKSPDYQQIGMGGTANFTITVTNTGETALTAVTVTDALVPACDHALGDLAIGASTSYACSSTSVPADFTNTANVTGDDPLGNPTTDVDTADVDVIDPAISVSKTPDLQTLLSGEDASFTITVSNDGDTAVTNVVVSDPLAPGCDATFATLASGEVQTISCTVVGVIADFTNVVDVVADSPLGGTISVSDDAVVDVVFPGVEIQKTPDVQQVVTGDDATFTITVTNTGDQDLVGLVISDPQVPACDSAPFDLAVGATTSFTCTESAVVADFTNIAWVDGVDALGNPVSDSDDAAVDVIDPSIAISKTPDVQTVVSGGTATFTIEVTNTGDVDLVDVVVTDPAVPACDASFAVLVPAETRTSTCSISGVTSDFTNTADVTGDDPLGNARTASDTGDVTVLVPSIEIQKSPDLQLVAVGDDATFTITVTNTGQTALANVTVDDPLVPACSQAVGALAIGETQSYSCVLATPAADFTNTATVTADDPIGNPTGDSDTADVDVIAPALSISKTPDLQSVPLGGTANFTVQVTNTGDVVLTSVVVSDPVAPGCDGTFATLAVGATATTTCSIVVSGDVTNTASATALDPNDETVDAGSDTGDVVALLPAVLVEKTPDTQAIGVGQNATFDITVSNVGDVTLVSVDVVDALAPTCDATVGPLLAGESVTYPCTMADVLADVTNTVDASAVDGNGNVVTSSASADVTVLPGSITITKVPVAPTVVDGGDIDYTITVENTGPADLVSVVVTDPTLPACDATFAGLLVGETQTWTCTDAAVDASTSDPVVNTIAVSADDEAGDPVTDSATSTVDVLVPALTITKTATPTLVTEGDDVVFEISVVNSGETPLSNVDVVDDTAPACNATYVSLAIGETQTSTCTVSDVTSDITNTAVATGVDPIGGTVTASATASVTVVRTGVLTGFVFTDEDRDGVYEPADGDAPVGGVDVVITNATGDATVVTTDATGTYSATLVVGDHTVEVDESDPDFPAYYDLETTGTDGQTVTVDDVAPSTAEPVGYGRAPVGALAGTIWHDMDGDGIVDVGEPVVSSVSVTATSAGPDGIFETSDDIVLTTFTDGGAYRFDDLTPGSTRVDVDPATLPPGLVHPTFDLDGELDSTTIVVVEADRTATDVDFGYTDSPNAPPEVLTLTVSGTVGHSLERLTVLDPEGNAYTVRLVGGALPAGTALATDGAITGIPTESGTFTITVEACDVLGECALYEVAVNVTAPAASTNLPSSGADSTTLARSALVVLLTGLLLLGMSRRRINVRRS